MKQVVLPKNFKKLTQIGLNNFTRFFLALFFLAAGLFAADSSPFGTRVNQGSESTRDLVPDSPSATGVDQQTSASDSSASPDQTSILDGDAAPKKHPKLRPSPKPTPEFQQVQSAPVALPASPSPENQVDITLSKHPVVAEELLAVLGKYPDLVIEKLKKKPIELQGIVERVQILGLDKGKVEVSLQGRGFRHLILCDDLGDPRRGNNGFSETHNYDGEVHKCEWSMDKRVLSLSPKNNPSSKNIFILTEDRPYSANVMLVSVSPAALRFEVVPGSSEH